MFARGRGTATAACRADGERGGNFWAGRRNASG